LTELLSLTKKNKQARMPALFLLFVLATFILSACSSINSNNNWPALTLNDGTLYLAHGAGVTAFDVESGSQLWTYPETPQATLLFYAPPSANENQIVVGDYGVAGGFFAPGVTVTAYGLDTDGIEKWRNADVFSDRVAAGIVQNEDTVFVGTNDNFIYALNANDGTVKWSYEAGHSFYANLLLEGDTLYAASLDKSLYALDANTGNVVWEHLFAGAIMNAPALTEDAIYVSSFNHILHRLDHDSGETAWDFTTTGFLWSGPAVEGNKVLVGDLDGVLYSVSADTGTEICSLATEAGSVQAAPVVVDGTAYFVLGSLDANVEEGENAGTLLAMSTDTCTQKWAVSTQYPIFTQPVLVNDTIAIVPSNAAPSILFYNFDGSPAGASLTPRSATTE
jgi:outer membrane protein assembly factor BamB